MMKVAIERDVNPFGHISLKFRGKVAKDFLSFLQPDKTWDMERFNRFNDYQRHLYALFLKIAGYPKEDIWEKIYVLCGDVEPMRQASYVDDVLYSEIVGFKRADGTFLPIPNQAIEEA